MNPRRVGLGKCQFSLLAEGAVSKTKTGRDQDRKRPRQEETKTGRDQDRKRPRQEETKTGRDQDRKKLLVTSSEGNNILKKPYGEEQ